MLGNTKSVQMAEFFNMLFSKRAVKSGQEHNDKILAEINMLERELSVFESCIDDADYNESAEIRNDINYCKRRICDLQEQLGASDAGKNYDKIKDVLPAFQKTLTDAENNATAVKLARLKTARQTINKAYESINLIGMTDADAIKCRKLASIHQQITNAIKQNLR